MKIIPNVMKIIPKTKTEFAIWVYCIAIALLAVSAGVIVVKLMFWPPCTQSGNSCVIDVWSLAGLAATILGVAATVLGVLGAIVVAGWWLSMNNRVDDQVKKLYKAQEKEIAEEIRALIDKSLLTKYELEHLKNFIDPKPFMARNSYNFMRELDTLIRYHFIEQADREHGRRTLEDELNRAGPGEVNVEKHFKVTKEGKEYFEKIQKYS